MARYLEIADSLRHRIQTGEFTVKSMLPPIAALMYEYKVQGLNTIRKAQQVLVAEGMLETRQGVGAFVIADVPVAKVDPVEVLTRARDDLTKVIRQMQEPLRAVTFDLTDDEDTYWVLTEALADYARLQRSAANDGGSARERMRWAEAAEAALRRIEDSVSGAA